MSTPLGEPLLIEVDGQLLNIVEAGPNKVPRPLIVDQRELRWAVGEFATRGREPWVKQDQLQDSWSQS